MNGEAQAALRDTYRDGLLSDTLPFWLKHGVDREQGGFLTCLDRDGSVVDRRAWSTSWNGRFPDLLRMSSS